MDIQKKYFLNKFCLFREKRNYLHSTDIFNQIIYFINNKNIKNLEINFKNKIINKPYLIITREKEIKIKENYFIDFNYRKNNEHYFGFIFQSEDKIVLRKKYDEINFQKKLKLNKKSVIIPSNTNFNFIQRITSSAMKFLKTKSFLKDKRKWYLVKLKIINSKELGKKNLIKIISRKGNENINFFSIYNKKKIGEMLFLKK